MKPRTLYNDQGFIPTRHNNYKYIYTQYRNTTICKAYTKTVKGEISSTINTIRVEDFNTPLSSMNKLSIQRIDMETQAFK